MIKVVFFDLGNVILPVDGYRMARKLAQHTSLSQEQILDVFLNGLAISHFETGNIEPREWFNTIADNCKLKDIEYEEFVPIFNDIFEENDRMISLIPRVKKNYKLGMISNTNTLHATYLVNKYPFFNEFDKILFSNDIKTRKPDSAIYKMALGHFGIEPYESIFIDDLPINIKGATDIGMKSIQFTDHNALEYELTKLGVEF